MGMADRPPDTKRMLCRFDSPQWLGELLIDAIGAADPRRILDLGSGGGVLSLAALSRWRDSELVTVDVDAAAADEIQRMLPPGRAGSHRHLFMDVLEQLPAEPHGVSSGTIDLVLSNPPYRTARWTPTLGSILQRAGFPAPASICGDIPVDLIFLAQALHLVRAGGSLGLILPDSMISGVAMRPFRRALASRHRVIRVIQLPRRAFKGTDAQAYVVVVRRGGASSSVRLDRLATDGTWLTPVHIDLDAAEERMDHAFHDRSSSRAAPGRVPLRDLDVEVTRGALNSKQIAASPLPTFHTSNFPPEPGTVIALPPVASEGPGRAPCAAAGDILLARVDRRLERKIALVGSGEALISDCVLRLRCPEAVRARVLAGLLSVGGQEQLVAFTRGTGPRHIGVASLMDVMID